LKDLHPTQYDLKTKNLKINPDGCRSAHQATMQKDMAGSGESFLSSMAGQQCKNIVAADRGDVTERL
jgi:hypothetical protein